MPATPSATWPGWSWCGCGPRSSSAPGRPPFELIRHIGDGFLLIALPSWMNHPVAPIAIDDVLYYLNAAADPALLPAGAYDMSNGEQPSYAQLLKAYARARGLRRVWVPFPAVPPRLVAAIASRLTPLPRDLVADLIMSLPNTMNGNMYDDGKQGRQLDWSHGWCNHDQCRQAPRPCQPRWSRLAPSAL